jgi:hypothetical protein
MTDTGTVLWSELMTTEVEKAKSFDGETLGLSFEPFGDNTPGYGLATSDGRPYRVVHQHGCRRCRRAGCFGAGSGGRTLHAGVRGAHRRPHCLLQDPTGALIGWMKPVPRE